MHTFTDIEDNTHFPRLQLYMYTCTTSTLHGYSQKSVSDYSERPFVKKSPFQFELNK